MPIGISSRIPILPIESFTSMSTTIVSKETIERPVKIINAVLKGMHLHNLVLLSSVIRPELFTF